MCCMMIAAALLGWTKRLGWFAAPREQALHLAWCGGGWWRLGGRWWWRSRRRRCRSPMSRDCGRIGPQCSQRPWKSTYCSHRRFKESMEERGVEDLEEQTGGYEFTSRKMNGYVRRKRSRERHVVVVGRSAWKRERERRSAMWFYDWYAQ
jgi:hypothetical protein